MKTEPQLSERLFRIWLMGYLSCFYDDSLNLSNAKAIQKHATTIIDFMKEHNLLNAPPQ